MTSMTSPPFDTLYRPRPGHTAPAIHLDTRNPLAGTAEAAAADLMASSGLGGIVLAWSGWFGEPDASPHGWVQPDLRVWSGPGRLRLDEVVIRAVPELAESGARLWLRPHARHVLSDGPSCGAFLRTHAAAAASGVLGLLIDLELLLTPPMRERRAEHTERILHHAASGSAGVAAVAMTSEAWSGPAGAAVAEVLGPAALCLSRPAEPSPPDATPLDAPAP